jgi:alpha-glucuronidase
MEVCSAGAQYKRKPGWKTLNIRYFDQNDGSSRYRLYVNEQKIDEWIANDTIPTRRIDSHSSARRLVKGVPLRAGDLIRVEGTPNGGETAALDYIEVLPASELPDDPQTGVSKLKAKSR